MSDTSGKSSWPELLYVLATPAVMKIATERPDVAVEVLPPGSPDPDPDDFDPERVRVYVDERVIVIKIPIIG